MLVTTGLPSMAPFYIFLYSFTMDATAFYPDLFIPAFVDIFVKMTFFAIFMNERI